MLLIAGLIERKVESIANYRFSDEREWRYAPDVDENKELLVGEKIYEEKEGEFKDQYKDCRLKFEPSDIRYLIIKDDSEIGDVVEFLKKTVGKKHPLHEVERLTTRILTTEQIIGDF